MTAARDPYAVLGLQPGASPAEIKRAYRRLAKVLHPDSAGERSLPAFLAVQEAYERLTGTRVRTVRAPGTGTGPTTTGAAGSRGGTTSGFREPWRADPERARAAREQARARRAAGQAGAPDGRSTGPAASGPAAAPGHEARDRSADGASAGGAAPRAGSTRPGSSTSGGADARSWTDRGRSGPEPASGSDEPGASDGAGERAGSAASGRRRRATRKATMGSTSYDEARDATDPRWAGASWYGPTTGEYWIVNPREYADPRKHGPGYSSRVRSGSRSDEPQAIVGGEASGADGPGDATSSAGPVGRASAAPAEPHGDRARGPASRSDAADAQTAAGDAGPAIDARAPTGDRASSPPRPARASSAHATAAESASAVAAAADGPAPQPWAFNLEGLLRTGTSDPLRRLGLVLLAWAPIGIAAAGIIGDLTGCSTYSTACDGTDPFLPWVAQAAILGILLVVPPLTRVLAAGGLGLVLGLVPATALVIAAGGARSALAGSVLVGALAVAWLAGAAWAAWRMLRPRGGPAG